MLTPRKARLISEMELRQIRQVEFVRQSLALQRRMVSEKAIIRLADYWTRRSPLSFEDTLQKIERMQTLFSEVSFRRIFGYH